MRLTVRSRLFPFSNVKNHLGHDLDYLITYLSSQYFKAIPPFFQKSCELAGNNYGFLQCLPRTNPLSSLLLCLFG